MSVDDRLRSRLQDGTPTPDLAVDELLQDALSRGKRRRAARFLVTGASILVVALAITWAVASGMFERESEPIPPAQPSLVKLLAGEYKATITSDEPRARHFNLVGDYKMTITEEGVFDLQGPPAFENRWTSPAGPIEATGEIVRIFANQAHCGDFGTYEWSGARGGPLTFTLVDDDCRFRRVLLSREWTPLE